MESESKKLASAKEVFGVYMQHTRRYPWLFLFTILGGLTVQAGMLAAPLFLRNFFNLLATHSPDEATLWQMTILLGLTALMYFSEWIGRRVQSISTMLLQTRVMADLLGSTFEYLIRHSYNFFISRFAGSLTHRVNKFSRAYETLFDSIILSFFPTLLFVMGAIVVLGMRSLLLASMLGLWALSFIAFQIYVSVLRQPLRVARAEADTQVTATLADAISNQSTIALFSGAKHEHGRFSAVVEGWRAATKRSWFADDWIWAGIGIFMLVIEIALLYGGMILWSRGVLTVGDFVLIQAYLLTTFDRLVSINRELRRFYDAYADASEMVGILNTTHEIKDAPDASPLHIVKGEIHFNAANFQFHTESSIFTDFALTVAGGEKIALVGPSGAGKSTVTKLLLRLYNLNSGNIQIDGQNIADVTQDSLRNAIAFVPQEPILFHRSLMENIRYGRMDASDAEVVEAAQKAHCHEFIASLPLGYETFVGERGVKLSGGERQRVAIARAILKNAPILILDEATSSLDSESEALIQDALEVLMQGKTVIVIAHRLSTIMKMDRIVVLEGGKIAAEGTHTELLAQDGLYQKLWSIQAGGFLKDEEPEEAPEKEEVDV